MAVYSIPAARLVALLCRREAYGLAESEARFPARVAQHRQRWLATLSDAELTALGIADDQVLDDVAQIRADSALERRAAEEVDA